MFQSFEGGIESETEDFDGASAQFSIDVASINTNFPDRDNHLRSADFFDVANFPKITFENGKLSKAGNNHYKLTGELTMKATTKTVEMDVVYGGTMVDGYGNTKVGFEITGKVNRKEFGLTWDMVTEAGGVVVGDIITLSLNIQLARV